MPPKDVFSEALKLSPGERAELAYQLVESLDEASDASDYDDAWAAEITRRLEDLDAGRATARPARQALEELRRKLHASR